MNSTALTWVLGVVICWGLYSVFLHMGSLNMKLEGVKPDLTANRMKAFLWVGIAYFLVAVVGPIVVLKLRGAAVTQMPAAGSWFSLTAGLLGAVGAFCLLMALSSGRNPQESRQLIALVPTLVFAGAPLVNAMVSVTKERQWGHTPWQFFLGLVLAAVGAGLVMAYKPSGGHAPAGGPKTGAAPAAISAAPRGGAAALPVRREAAAVREERPVAEGYADVTKRQYFVS